MDKILITGAQGFIGRNILEQIGGKYHFLSPSREELDLLDFESVQRYLKKEKPNILVHLANVGGNRKEIEMPDITYINLKMFFNLIQCKENFQRLIMIGSGAEYDKSHPIVNITEQEFGRNIPADQYGFYKYVCSKYAQEVDYITHLRIFGIYGKYEDYTTRFISNAICRALCGLDIEFNQNVFFDYLYVNDFVKILELIIQQKPCNKFLNIGSGIRISLLDIARVIKEEAGGKAGIVIRKEGLNNEYTCDITSLKHEFSGINFTPLRVAVREMVDYYRKEIVKINKEDLLFDK
ncbi:MAG TPA: NAD(P)-dependent oxidoreductase [Candidatus Pacearchaeota archaeon]|nr:NAD(P)-dependent oxidoreductase [Candidatus Pacearchaeota archaeon]